MWQQVPTETTAVQDFINFSLTWLQDHRYTLTVDVNMAAWTRVMAGAPSSALVNPTFDPRFNRLSPDNSFWLDIRAGSTTIATSAARLFLTEDYLALKRSTKLWYDPPRSGDQELDIVVPADMPVIAGRVGHEGGLWVHPKHRMRGLSVILPHLNRALCYRQWQVDWQTGLTTRRIAESGIAELAYGFPHVVQCYEGNFLLTQRPDRLFVVYMNREELLAGLELDTVARLLPDRHRETRHSGIRVHER